MIDGLRHNAQAEGLSNFCHDLERLFTQSLEGIGRGTWFVGAAAKKLRAGRGDLLCHRECLVAGLNRTRTCHDRQVFSANAGVRSGKVDDRVFFFDIAAHQFVRLGDSNHLGDAGQFFQGILAYRSLISSHSNRGAQCAGHRMCAESKTFDVVADGADFLRTGLLFHDNQHGEPFCLCL